MIGEAPNKTLYPYERYIFEYLKADHFNEATKEFHYNDFSMYLFIGNIWDKKIAYSAGLTDYLHAEDIKALKSARFIISTNSGSNTFDVLRCSSKLDAKKEWNAIAYNRARWLTWW